MIDPIFFDVSPKSIHINKIESIDEFAQRQSYQFDCVINNYILWLYTMAKGQSETLQSNEHVGIFYYLINFGLFVLALFPTRYRCLADVRKLEVETNKRLTYLGSWKFLPKKTTKAIWTLVLNTNFLLSPLIFSKVFLIGRDKSRWTFWHCQCIKTISVDTDTQITYVTQTGRST
jgi:hypothetical protein